MEGWRNEAERSGHPFPGGDRAGEDPVWTHTSWSVDHSARPLDVELFWGPSSTYRYSSVVSTIQGR